MPPRRIGVVERSAKVADNLTTAQRSYCMSRVRVNGTDIEQAVVDAVHRRRWRYEAQAKDLPGKPDVIFRRLKVAVFVDGDFWHGYRFPTWRDSLSKFWQEKIEKTRRRDQRNFGKLRRQGWVVLRVWQHEVHDDIEQVMERICDARTRASGRSGSKAT